MIRRRRHASRGSHERNQLVAAADWAITRASRRARSGGSGLVTVADVIEQAADQFNLHVEDAQARAVLRERYTLRGGAIGLSTDAF